MRVYLVAVERPGSRRWHVSLDPSLRADVLYHAQRRAAVRLWRSARPYPLGTALAEVRRLNRDGRRPFRAWRPEREPVVVPADGGKIGSDPFLDKLSGEAPGAEENRVISGGHADAADKPADLAGRLTEAMAGRSLLAEEFESLVQSLGLGGAGGDWRFLAQWGILSGWFTLRPSVEVAGRRGRPLPRKRALCLRCGADERWMRYTACASCGETCPYCERCLTMGRARACTPLIAGAAKPSGVAGTVPERFVCDGGPATGNAVVAESDTAMAGPSGGTASATGERDAVADALSAVPGLALNPVQEEAAREALRFVLSSRPSQSGGEVRSFLIWAVTGAGKTEMIFPLIAAVRARGGRVAVATPRKDVVLELVPRISAAFPEEKVAGLYGGAGRKWPTGGIIVSTTHQLIRHEAAFDLVVLDEVDAFPFHGDPMLAHAARKALKPGAAFVMLSATPPRDMQRDVRRGRLPCATVPVRHHRHPLPVPACERPAKLAALLIRTLERGAQAFVFVPRIAMLEPELARLRKALDGVCPPGRIEATSSRDPMREDKVRRLRAGDIRILLTTTILERGVTIPKADVYVLEADHRLFDAAALVQMAGRAGRSAEDPEGRVAFLAVRLTREQRRAIREIRRMNKLARQKGWLAKSGDSGRRGNRPAPESRPSRFFGFISGRASGQQAGSGAGDRSANRKGWRAWRD